MITGWEERYNGQGPSLLSSVREGGLQVLNGWYKGARLGGIWRMGEGSAGWWQAMLSFWIHHESVDIYMIY